MAEASCIIKVVRHVEIHDMMNDAVTQGPSEAQGPHPRDVQLQAELRSGVFRLKHALLPSERHYGVSGRNVSPKSCVRNMFLHVSCRFVRRPTQT